MVFSGINNHNHNVIFAGAIVANEKEETYVWVLEQFLEAMSGKSPISVITDGDLAMKNAIKKVFPNAYHRLCAWHLIRNATSNVGVPEFVGRFRICMLGDYDLGEFRRRWTEMVDTFGLKSCMQRERCGPLHTYAAIFLLGSGLPPGLRGYIQKWGSFLTHDII